MNLLDCCELPFSHRHHGPPGPERQEMLATLGVADLEELTSQIVPPSIRRRDAIGLPAPLSETEALRELQTIAAQNVLGRCFIGQGYYGTVLPGVIQRNVLENPGWYTQYTPYQAEIAQGRLEALLNFQTMVNELTGLPFANASLLDEGTAAAEAMALAFAEFRQTKPLAVADAHLHPQTLEVLRTRARALNMRLKVLDVLHDPLPEGLCAVLVQVPDTLGRLRDGLEALSERSHAAGALLIAIVDPLAQCLLKTPASWGADVAVGSSQRFGLPLGFGGPHAGFMAVSDALKRRMPGRIVGVSVDRHGKPAYRLSLQTREQHIRREKATSNICTAQALPAILASMYALYHGPEGLRRIATRVQRLSAALQQRCHAAGIEVERGPVFDTVTLRGLDAEALRKRAQAAGLLFRYGRDFVGISFDETTTLADLDAVCQVLGVASSEEGAGLPAAWGRQGPLLPHKVFHRYHSEHEMLRYLHRLQQRDLSLTHSMIALGSCTMKLNATAEMIPVTWPGFANLHPAAPLEHQAGYRRLCGDLERWLSQITELPACSLQPNAGSQGELAGLLAIRAYHEARGDADRTVCLIPASAHGTNPASAVMAGFRVVAVDCDEAGNVDLVDLRAKAEAHAGQLAALMITYPSTHGVFEEDVSEICRVIHQHGGQVYMDGANMNAQVGLTSPGRIGADVCHLNLHKTFCIPHGGGGPGMGPICTAEHLRPHLPTDPLRDAPEPMAISASAYGSGCILVVSWMYIRMMGDAGLTEATQMALLNANYMAARLSAAYPVLYTGRQGRCAHEFILDLRELTKQAGLIIDDVAKRLMDYGFHAPTMSWPVAGTLMIEPTESESKEELDRFCEAMLGIRREIQDVLDGLLPASASPLHFAPHTAEEIASDTWDHAYGREQAAFPCPWVRERKFWPAVGRIDNTYGDRNLVCSCEWDGKDIG